MVDERGRARGARGGSPRQNKPEPKAPAVGHSHGEILTRNPAVIRYPTRTKQAILAASCSPPVSKIIMCRTLRIAAVVLLFWNATAAEIEPPALSLANVYRDNVGLEGYWVSEKLDGVRAWWDGEALYSRRGNRFNAPAAFVERFPKVALDGELWMGRGTFERLSGIVRRQPMGEDAWRGVRYMVFDLPDHPGTFDQRLASLRNLLDTPETSSIGLVKQFRVADDAELMATLDRIVANGGEGLMLRKGDSYYRRGRSNDLLKLKVHQDAEAVVVAHLPGRGKYTGVLGSLLVEMPDGRRFRLGTGFSDETRRRPPPVGTTVTYRHYGKTGNGIPRFASFLRIRPEL